MCGKSAEELAAMTTEEGPGSGSGESVVVPITTETPAGSAPMHIATISIIGGVSGSTRPKDLHRNIHGDKRFLVKIQTGLTSGAFGLMPSPQGALMVYDQTKSFTFNIMPPDLSQINALRNEIGGKLGDISPSQPLSPSQRDHPHPRLYEAITTRGVPCMNLGGLKGKGYFWARREGTNLRIFINEQEPMQPW